MSAELARRIAFTLGALLVFRIGSHIPIPGIDLSLWERLFPASGLLGALNMSSGGAVARLSVFALGILPLVSSAILLQLLGFVIPPLRRLSQLGERGRVSFDRITFALTAVLTLFQAWGVVTALEGVQGLVLSPGPSFVVTAALTLTGGTLFLVWLTGQITQRGIGNGISLMLATGVVTALPEALAGVLELGRQGALSTGLLVVIAAIAIALIALISTVERARSKISVEFPSGPATLSFKLNGAGVMPPILGAWVVAIVMIAIGFATGAPEWAGRLTAGDPFYMVFTAVAVFLLVFIYTAFVLAPTRMAESLTRLGGRIPNVEPGEPTAAVLDSILSRATLVGAVYLVTVCLIPEVLILWVKVPFYLGATSALVLVCTVLDLEKQARYYALVK